VADPRIVLKSRGLKSLVTVWRRKPRGPKEEERWSMWRENPPLMTVNAHPRNRHRSSAPPQEGQSGGSQPGCGKEGGAQPGRETMVATPTSRHRVIIGETWKREGVIDTRIPGLRDTDLKRIGEVIRGAVPEATGGGGREALK
jgi:hypothetical protein